MKKIIFLCSLVCITFNAGLLGMFDEENQHEVVSYESVRKLNKGDHVLLKKKFKQTKQDELSPISLGCKILGWCGTGALCLATTVAAVAGEYLTIVLVHDNQDNSRQETSSTAIMAGTTVGMGICAVGLCTYGCSVALTDCLRRRQAEKKRKEMHFVVEEEESV